MSTATPKGSTEGKSDDIEGSGDKTLQGYPDIGHSVTLAHRTSQEAIKSAFSSPLRAQFSSGRSVIPVVSSSNVIPISSSSHVSSISNSQPVITKAVARSVITDGVHTTPNLVQQHPSLIQGPAALGVSSPTMASIIRGPPHIQQGSSSHISHATVHASYSTHVPMGAAAVAACITNLKPPPVATPIKGTHIFAPSIISSTTALHSTVQKYSSTGLPLNTCLQPRTATLSSIRGTVLGTPKTLPASLSVTSPLEVPRPPPNISSNPLSSSQLLITSPRSSDGIVRPTIIQGTATLSKAHSFMQQISEKGHYKPSANSATVLSVQSVPASVTTTSSPAPVQPAVVSHPSPQLQPLSSTLHLIPHHPVLSSSASSIESAATSSFSSNNLSYSNVQLPKVVTQTVHTVAPASQLQLATTSVPVANRLATATTTVALTQSSSRPAINTSSTLTSSIPVAKVYPQPVTVTSKSSLEALQHQEVTRSVPPTSLFMSSAAHGAPSITTTSSTSATSASSGSISFTTSSVPSNILLSESKAERSSISSHPPYSFPPGTTYFYEPLQGSQSTLATMHTISGPPVCHSFATSTLRTGLSSLPSNQTSSVTLHSSAVRPSLTSRAPVNINPMVVTMSSTSRHQLVAPTTYATMETKHSSGSHMTDSLVTSSTTVSFSGNGTAVSYSSNSSQPASNTAGSSSRPSILRKRTLDGTSVAVKKNLLPPMPSAKPPSPRPEVTSTGPNQLAQGLSPLKPSKEPNHENGKPSENADNSCNGIHPVTVIIKQEPPESVSSMVTGSAPPPSGSKTPPIAIEASPRKKPRKQQLTGNELVEMHSTEGEDDFEKDKDILKKDVVKEAVVTVDEDNVRWVPAKKRHPVSLLNSYRHTWKSRHNHFMRHSDIKLKDERRPTVGEIANQKGVVQKANGWKVYYICSQIDDLVDLEATVHSRLSSLLDVLEKKPVMKEKDDVELSRASELMRGNIQRCKLIRDQMNDAKHQVLKVLDHKSRIVEIVGKFITTKPPGKKK